MNKTVIIAEVGECWNGELETARKLINAAAHAGCDYVKFQTLDSEGIRDSDPEAKWFRKVALTPGLMHVFRTWADLYKIKLLFTPENVRTAEWVADMRLPEVKVASSSIVDYELLEFVKDNFDTIFLSTGMASAEEVSAAVGFLSSSTYLYLMHCISEYPTGPLLEKRGLKALNEADVNLNMMKVLASKYLCKVGYSDHTAGILAPVSAVAMGAEVIEKHICWDRRDGLAFHDGTDYVLSAEPWELKEMVDQIRRVEKMKGSGNWQRTGGELLLKDFLRGRFDG